MPFTPEARTNKSGVTRYRGGFLHPATGKKVWKTFDYAYEAEAWADVAEKKAHRDMAAANGDDVDDHDQQPAAGKPAKPGRPARTVVAIGPTVGQYGADYLGRRHGLIATATYNKYRAWFHGFDLVWPNAGRIADRPMAMVKPRDVQQWMSDQAAAGVGHPTINGRLSFLRRLFADLILNEPDMVEADPTSTFDMLPTGVIKDRVLTPEEDEALLAAVDPVHRVAFLVALDAGLRWQETYALKVSDLDFRSNGAAYVGVSQVLERDSKIPRPWPKSKRPRKPVPMTERLEAALRDLVADKRRDDLLFPVATGGVWLYSNHLKRVWSPALYAIGEADRVMRPTKRIRKTGPEAGTPYLQARYTPNFGFHQLRHTFGSRLADDGWSRAEIAEMMDHADERTTKRYIHTGDDGRRFTKMRETEQRRRQNRTAG